MDEDKGRSAWTFQQITGMIVSIPEISSWPELCALLKRPPSPGIKPSWEYVCHACLACGGEWRAGFPGAAAILCLHYSIHLVDDLLDEDPQGLQHRLGPGPVGNLATVLQAAAGACLRRAQTPAEKLVAMHDELHGTVMDTGYGQHLDCEPGEAQEDRYWEVVRLKTPPLFRCALVLGALSGGASLDTAREIGRLGLHLGEIAQINDDLADALERPAAPDWLRPNGSLPLLFARLAEHEEQAKFEELVKRLSIRLDDREALEEAQEILLRSGAVSYCAYRLANSYRQGADRVDRSAVAHGEHLMELLDFQILPLRRLFERHGLDELDFSDGRVGC